MSIYLSPLKNESCLSANDKLSCYVVMTNHHSAETDLQINLSKINHLITQHVHKIRLQVCLFFSFLRFFFCNLMSFYSSTLLKIVMHQNKLWKGGAKFVEIFCSFCNKHVACSPKWWTTYSLCNKYRSWQLSACVCVLEFLWPP